MARYSSYLLRVWQSERQDSVQWSGRLEQLQGGGSLQFHDLEALLAHLRSLLAPRPAEGPTEGEQDAGEGPGALLKAVESIEQ